MPSGVQEFNPFDLDAAVNRNPSLVLDLHQGRIKVRKDQMEDIKDLLALTVKSRTIAPVAATYGGSKSSSRLKSPYEEKLHSPHYKLFDGSKSPHPPAVPRPMGPASAEKGSRKCAVVKKPEVRYLKHIEKVKKVKSSKG